MPDAEPPRSARPPFLITLAAAAPEMLPAGVAAAAVGLVALADASSFTTPLALLISIVAFVGTALAVLALVRRTRAAEVGRRAHGAFDLLALVTVLGWMAVNARYASQHLVVDRDPAVYTTAAGWLVHHQSLGASSGYQVFGVAVQTAKSGWSTTSSIAQYYPQGMHGVVVLIATVGRVFGTGTMLRANVVLGGLGLLAFYAAARLVVARGWAFMAMVALAVSLPQIHFSRDTYSEPLGQLAAWVGLAVFIRARAHGGWWPLALTGLVFGGSMTSRTDAFLGFTCIAAMAAVVAGEAPAGARRRAVGKVALLVASTVVPFLVGLYDLQHHSGTYYTNLHHQLGKVFKLDIAVIVLAMLVVAFVWWAPPWRLLVSRRRPLGLVLGGLSLVGFAGLAARPLFGVARAPAATLTYLGPIERAAGVLVDPTRSYTERSVDWLAYYLGPVSVVLGLIGLSALVLVVISGRIVLLPVLALVFPVAFGYFVQPDITPDQIWAVRRFLPIVLPAVLLGAAVVLAEVWAWKRRRRHAEQAASPLLRRSAALVLAVATVVVPFALSKPLLRVREHAPDLALFQGVCNVAGPRAALLFVNSDKPDGTAQLDTPALLSLCSVPVAWVAAPSRTTLAASAAAVAAAGRQLWVVTGNIDDLGGAVANQAGPTVMSTSRVWREEVSRAPHTFGTVTLSLWVGKVSGSGAVTIFAAGGKPAVS